MSSDPHTGGSLESMAATGTTIPADAGRQNIVPSDPNDNSTSAATNATDLPRGPLDSGATGEVTTAAGGDVPASVETKRLDFDVSKHAPQAKGHPRDAKHSDKENVRHVAEAGHGAAPAPGEEGDGQDEIRDRKGL